MRKLSGTTLALVVAAELGLVAAVQAADLEEIIVTARKREENIQAIPVAVSAISGATFDRAFIADTTALAQFAPNVVFDTVESGAAAPQGFSIRGISYQDVEKAFDPTVLVSIDGVVNATGTGNVFSLMDVERIEVLRGPQGTLFGKNAVGGVINVFRTKPKLNDTSGKLRARYGRFQKADLEGLFNYGADTWAVKLTAATLNQGKGYSRNTAGKEFDKTDTIRAGAHFLWAPTETFRAELQYNYSDMSGSPKATLDVSTDSRDLFCGLFDYCSGVLGEPATGNRRVTLAEFTGDVGIKQHQIISEVNFDVGDDYTLTYLGGWTSFDDVWAGDSDGAPYRIVEVHRYGDYEQFSNEIRITRHSGHALTWQAGFYFFNNSSDTNHLVDVGGPVFSPYELTKASSDSQSAFGEADLHLLDDKLVLTFGARYIRETKRLDRTVIDRSVTPNVTLLGPNAGGERTDDDVIYRAGARYQFNEDFMVYVTNSTGFRSGGFSPRASTPAIIARGFRPEKLISWEAGLRSTLLGGRATLNLTGFHMIYKDMQVEVSIPTPSLVSQISIENVGKAKFHGVELDFAFAATNFWQISGNAGWLDSKYTRFQADLYGDGIIADETQLKLRRAPKWTASVQSQLTLPIGEGELSWRVGYSWRDDYEETITNHPGTTTKSFGLLDSSLSYDLGAWTVAVFGRNLTNEDEWTHHYVVGPVRPTAGSPNNGSLWKFAMTRPPREYGLELTYRF